MQPIDQPLRGKILLITGAASGIGLATLQAAHALGARILAAHLRTTPAFTTFTSSKPNILSIQADVTQWPSFTRMFARCEETWHDVPDAYAICAGVFDPPTSNFWEDPEMERGYAQVDVNVSHPIKLTRLAVRKSLESGKRAAVCIIASVGGLTGSISAPLYCATKHAVVGFVKSMKDTEPLTGVKVTTLCPGGVMTPLFDTQKIKQYSVSKEQYLAAETCADFLLDLLQRKEYPCGSVLEVTTKGHRLIPEWNVEPPEGHGTGQEVMGEEALENLLSPIKETLARDRLGAKL